MSEFILNFHFIRPYWLLAIIPTIAVCVLLLKKSQRAVEWQSLIDKRLLPYLLDGKVQKAKRWPIFALLALWIIAIIAVAGPAWKKRPQPVHESVSGLVILWDLSPSMNASDVPPSRLTRARLKLIDLLNARQDGLTGLIAYGGEAHVVTPLTDDTETIISLLSGLSPGVMPVQGSNPEMALEKANKLLLDAGIERGNIVLLTDGIHPSALGTLAEIQREGGHKITIWGIGTKEGAPIPLEQGGFARNQQGEIVVPKLDEALLSDAAVNLNGIYVPFSASNADIKTILNFGLFAPQDKTRESLQTTDQWYESGPYLVLFLLPFAAMAFRRGWVVCVLFVLLNTATEEAVAFGWQDLWQTQQQQAQKNYDSGDVEQAAKQFKDPQWKGVAEYKSNNFEQALEQFSNGDSVQDHFNRGNTLTQLGRYDEAMEAFDQALSLDNTFTEAEDNKKIAQALKDLEEQQSQQDSNGENQQNNSDSDNQDSQDQQNENGQQQDSGQQNSENQNSEQQNSQQENDQQQSQNSDQQSGDENNQQSQQDQKDGDENKDSQSQQDNNNLNEEQQKALDEKYGSSQEEQNQNRSTEEKPAEESDQENQDQQTQMAQQQEKTDQDTGNEDEQQGLASMPMSAEEREEAEQQQALEQWLRKVPDDPSGLLRNKFRHEYKQRLRESRRNRWQAPGTKQNNERW